MRILLTAFRIPLLVTLAAIVATALLGHWEEAILLTLLAALEISISFDNAVVNATVLRTMSRKWQQIFLTWGILIAVFGMRLVFPILIVAAAAGIGIPNVIDMALNRPTDYAHKLEQSNAVIAGFGGMFLLLVFLNYFFDPDKDVHWLGSVESRLAKLGKLSTLPVLIAGVALLIVSAILPAAHQKDVLVSGVAGLVTYLLVAGIASLLEPDDIEGETTPHIRGNDVAATVGKAGFASFMYLEVLDASFSFDGVIGAFAITKNVIIIALGLGIGALYVRTLTIYLVRQGTLSEYRYLEHGAHWAIGALAVLLFIGIEHHVPEVITGLLGAGMIAAAFIASILWNRKHRDDEDSGAPEKDPSSNQTSRIRGSIVDVS
jgi:hypothetical protein